MVPNLPPQLIEYQQQLENQIKRQKQLQQQHIAAFKTKEEAVAWQSITGKRGEIVKMEANDPNLYYPAFGIKITDTMKGTPFKLYKKEGGLVVNIFA